VCARDGPRPGTAGRPAVSSTILGARTLDQLEVNLRAAGPHLTVTETAALDAASDSHPTDYPYGALGVEQRSRMLYPGLVRAAVAISVMS
jgi:aryl-alcohol dehydrogenase (NADP+)